MCIIKKISLKTKTTTKITVSIKRLSWHGSVIFCVEKNKKKKSKNKKRNGKQTKTKKKKKPFQRYNTIQMPTLYKQNKIKQNKSIN